MNSKFALIFFLAALAASGNANTLTANGGAGSSTIGTGGDYATLAAAAADFNSFAGGLTGNYTFNILNDLNEPNNLSFGNATNNFTLTIKPATTAASLVTVTFQQTTANTGGYTIGHLNFGSNDVNGALDALVPTRNVVIDGSKTAGSGRNLRLTNTAVLINSAIIRLRGDCTGFTVKNCEIVNIGGSNTGTTNGCTGLYVTARQTTTPATLLTNNLTVSDCLFTETGPDATTNGGNGICVNIDVSGTIPVGSVMTGGSITSCTMTAKNKCIIASQFGNMNISGNTFNVIGVGTNRPQVIQFDSANGTSGWTWNLYNNIFQTVSTTGAGNNWSFGFNGVETGNFNIFNNIFTGYSYTGAQITGDALWRVIAIDGGNDTTTSATATWNIYHNSINLANADYTSTAKPGRYAAISQFKANFQGAINIKNNVIRTQQQNGIVYFRATGGPGTFVADFNDIYLDGTAQLASYKSGISSAGTYDYPTLASWIANNTDPDDDNNSKGEDPLLPGGPGKWFSSANLHFNGTPSSNFVGAPLASLTLTGNPPLGALQTDIDGQARNATAPIKGADEPVGIAVTAADGEWMLLN